MIKRVTIREVGAFDKTGVVMDNLQRVNIVYGSNGSGKTTISKMLEYGYAQRGYKQQTGVNVVKPWKYPKCIVEWDGKPVQVLVYNMEFRKRVLAEHFQGESVLVKDAVGQLGYNPMLIPNNLQIGLVMPNLNMKKLEEEKKRVEYELEDRLWKEVHEANPHIKKLLKGYNRKTTFARYLRKIVNEKLKGDLFWKILPDIQEINANNVWYYLANESKNIIEKAEKELALLRNAEKECERVYENALKVNRDKNEMGEADAQVVKILNYDLINKVLDNHGYTGFSIQPTLENAHTFQIQRENGSYVKDTLSEGEETVVSFLVFLDLVGNVLKDNDREDKKVVVIDDPIGSLDYGAIEMVSTLTNDLIKKARRREGGIEQVIVLTHNASYQKSLNVNQPRSNTHYWSLTKVRGVSRLTAYERRNPVKSDYQELWSLLKDGNNGRIKLPMVMKRILEIYFLEYGRYDYNTIMSMIGDKKTNPKGERDWDMNMSKFRQIFEKLGHEAHYKMMMSCR